MTRVDSEAATVGDGDAGEIVQAMLAVSQNAIAKIGPPVLTKIFIRSPCAKRSTKSPSEPTPKLRPDPHRRTTKHHHSRSTPAGHNLPPPLHPLTKRRI